MIMAKLEAIKRHDGSHYGYAFRCPGCRAFAGASPDGDDTHVIPTTGPKAWGFNGNVGAPTFTPSILVYEVKRQDGSVFSPRCHSFVTDGRIQFLGDCGHPLAGQTVELPDAT